MTKLTIPALALALAGCAPAAMTSDALAFTLAAQVRGVNVDGEVTPDEASGYLGAAAATWGSDVPAEWRPVVEDVCAMAALIETDLDAEAAEMCESFAP